LSEGEEEEEGLVVSGGGHILIEYID